MKISYLTLGVVGASRHPRGQGRKRKKEKKVDEEKKKKMCAFTH